MNEINKELLQEQKYWVDIILKKFIDKNGGIQSREEKYKGQKMSHPFYMGLTQSYIENKNCKKRVMVVGQETMGFGIIDNGTAEYEKIACLSNIELYEDLRKCIRCSNEPILSQQWAIAYLESQLGENLLSVKPDLNLLRKYDIAKNNTPFWDAMRVLAEKFEVCWNNLDKVHYEKTLSTFAEQELSKRYEKDGQKASLLQREIEIAQPNAIIFFTGPNYSVSMQTALLSENGNFNSCPQYGRYDTNIDGCVIDITEEVYVSNPQKFSFPQGFKALWTYHPGWLRREKILEEVLSKLEKLLDRSN